MLAVDGLAPSLPYSLIPFPLALSSSDLQRRRASKHGEKQEMPKSTRGKSTARKPLADISNGGKPSKKAAPPPPPADGGSDDGALDRLLLARSDLASLINQIDELVVQALKHKMISKTGSKDIESFRHVLSDMHSSLKPWASKLEQAFGGPSVASEKVLDPFIDSSSFNGANGGGNVVPSNKGVHDINVVPSNKGEHDMDLIVSPSPLVSWRAGACTVERGKQLFLLTPLPKPTVLSSKYRGSSRTMVGVLDEKNPHITLGFPPLSIPKNACADLMERVEAKMAPSNASKPCTVETASRASQGGFLSPSFSNHKSRRKSLYLLTPCLKASPPKSIALADPLLEFSQNDDADIPNATQENTSQIFNDITSGEGSVSLAPRYQELLELHPDPNLNWRKDLDGTLDWFLSPPKTCILMEPSDKKLLPTPTTGTLLATPMVDFESTVRKGKHHGESTLKRELWVKFDAVSTNGLHLDASIFQKPARKGFLDMLEEEACETKDSDTRVA